MDNDLVLEQFLSPASPMLAGFRLDGFSAIKPRITHSPSSDFSSQNDYFCLLEDRFICPAVLYIQVSAFQVERLGILFCSGCKWWGFSLNLELTIILEFGRNLTAWSMLQNIGCQK